VRSSSEVLGSEDVQRDRRCGRQQRDNQAAASTVGFIAGAALLGGGAYLYFMAPKAGNLTAGPTVGAGSAGLSLRGIW
jgi:hypothetical protein